MGACSETRNKNKTISSTSLSNYNKIGNKTYTFNGTKSYNLIVHKNDGMNDYIIEMTLSKFDKNSLNKKSEFIMILDVSGSMAGHVHKLISDIIPKGLNLLNYSDNDIIHLITFQSVVNYYKKTIKELKDDSSMEGNGGTEMYNVYEKVKYILENNDQKKIIEF